MYSSSPSIVIVASDNSDPTALGSESVEIAIKIPSASSVRVGEGQSDILYNERASKLSRRQFKFSCLQLYVRAAQGSGFQTIGVIRKLERLWETYEYMWLYEVREVFGESTPFAWADEGGGDAMFYPADHAETPGIMPVRVSLREPSQSPPSGGYIDVDLQFDEESI